MNIERFKELADGDSSACRELIDLYVQKTEEQLEDLRKAVSSANISGISTIAHSMTGASLMVGIDSLAALLRKLEQGADEKDLSKVRPTFADVDKEFRTVRDRLLEVGNSLQNFKK